MDVYVAFVSDASYAPYLGVSIHSLIQRASEKNNYYLYILDAGIDWWHKKKISCMEKENIHIEFKDITSIHMHYKDDLYDYFGEHSYYLWLDEIFPDLEKILYLDSDTIILHDVAELYSEDVDDFILGGAKVKYSLKSIQSNLNDGQFDTGVMLINLCLYRKNSVRKRIFDTIINKSCCVQEMLNTICYGQVKYIDNGWNFQWSWFISLQEEKDLQTYKTLNIEKEDAVIHIIHYNSGIKPWNHPEYDFAHLFWAEASQVSFYDEIILISSREYLPNIFSDYIFPWEGVSPNSRIIIYGGGKVGKVFCRQLYETGYCKVLAICDKHHEQVTSTLAPVITVEKLKCMKRNEYDAIVIAIANKDIAMQVKCELEQAGLFPVSWRNPCRY